MSAKGGIGFQPVIRRNAIVFVTLVGLATAGCHSLPIVPNANREWVRELKHADSLVLEREGIEQEIHDPQTIARLNKIYASAKFATYWHTLPATFGKKNIKFRSNGIPLRHLSFTGVLWESTKEKGHRTAKLIEEDRIWIESLFGQMKNE